MFLRKKLVCSFFIISVFCTIFLINSFVSFAADPIPEKKVDKTSKFVSLDFNNVDNTVIDIEIPILRDNENFILTSQVNLRNRQAQLPPEVSVEAIIEQ